MAREVPGHPQFWVSSSEDDVEAGITPNWGEAVFTTDFDWLAALQALQPAVNLDDAPVEDLHKLLDRDQLLLTEPGVRTYARLRLRCRELRLAGRIAEAQAIEHGMQTLYESLPAYFRW
jgi:hypothetical protein